MGVYVAWIGPFLKVNDQRHVDRLSLKAVDEVNGLHLSVGVESEEVVGSDDGNACSAGIAVVGVKS